MPKITTADCEKAVVAAFPAEFGTDSSNWKRYSKSGKKGEPIVRVFHHRALPLQALVTEVDGTIVGTTFKGLATWDVPSGSAAEEEIDAIFNTQAGYDFIAAHDLFKPSDFLFYVTDVDEGEGIWYTLCPVAYFNRNGCTYDGELDHFLRRHLPDDGGEATEGTFISDLDPEPTRERLLALGFVRDAKYDAMMSGNAPAGDDD